MPWKKVGAAWNTDKGGISLRLDSGEKYMLFENTYKEKDKHPDWNLCIPEDDDGDDPPF